jgi:putative exporter of polyketide antibiotics
LDILEARDCGGIAFILAGLLYIISTIIRMSAGNLPWYLVVSWSLIIAGPAFLIGILFLINWFKKKK